MNIRTELENTVGLQTMIQLNDVDLNPAHIRAILINEVVPADPRQDFYGSREADYLTTTFALFREAGLPVTTIQELLDAGIYITNAVKIPKTESTVENSAIDISLPYLKKELSLFPQLKAILLMGDVAKKAFNKITKQTLKKNIVPAISTYKLRNSELYYGDIRVFPSYIMTGEKHSDREIQVCDGRRRYPTDVETDPGLIPFALSFIKVWLPIFQDIILYWRIPFRSLIPRIAEMEAEKSTGREALCFSNTIASSCRQLRLQLGNDYF